jgi:hypothetical protein
VDTLFTNRSSTIQEIVSSLELGELALPDFQRSFVWTTLESRALLGSVLSGLPTGALLRSEYRPDFGARSLEYAPAAVAPKWLLLDGQQRLTALYAAIGSYGPFEYFVNFSALSASNDFIDEESIICQRRNPLDQPTLAMFEPSDLRIPISALWNEASFFGWLRRALPEIGNELAGEIRSVVLAKLVFLESYSFPVVEVDRDAPSELLIRVFERVNRWGLRLEAFDLLSARLRDEKWSIAEKWQQLLDEDPNIGRVFGTDGVLPLQVAALSSLSRLSISGVTGQNCLRP